MPKTITVPFSESGIPKLGLTPTVEIRDVSANTLLVAGGAVTEIGNGWYKYIFNEIDGYNANKDFVAVIDSGVALVGVERFAFGGSEFPREEFQSLLSSESGGFLA